MKRVFVFLSVVCVIFIFSSCRSAKETVVLSSINGEWNIVEINGSSVVPVAETGYPYIGFDTTSGKVYGNSGCNRMMGTFDVKNKPGELNLGPIAGSRMMCADMTLEQNVLNALKNVKGYKKGAGQKMALTNSSGRPVIVLVPRTATAEVLSLGGEWRITEVNGEAVSDDVEKKPYLNFDVTQKRIHGNAGCNTINGGFVTDDQKADAISFPMVAATMMACPDMTLEKNVLRALNQIKSFGVQEDKTVHLNDESGRTLLVLSKN